MSAFPDSVPSPHFASPETSLLTNFLCILTVCACISRYYNHIPPFFALFSTPCLFSLKSVPQMSMPISASCSCLILSDRSLVSHYVVVVV